MARYKPYSCTQGKFIPLHFAKQIFPGTFAYTPSHLIDHELVPSRFDERCQNDISGASADDPKILLEILPDTYFQGTVSSRKIERLCHENMLFMPLSADQSEFSIDSLAPQEITIIQRRRFYDH
ncbi:MAG: hypothetical protein PHZ02_06980 [Desulfocapsaceae bacterium]|nr:hypothetical protein [Desulfocapsaceae bacterium]